MADALSSWKDGAAKAAILDFVAAVTAEGGPDWVPPPDRIAVFDNDGTLWCEHPLQVQVYFGQARLEVLAQQDPGLRWRQPYKAYLEHDLEQIHALGKQALFEIAGATHAGMTEGEFIEIARAWLAKARHPILVRRFTELVYRPQLDLLAYLRDHGFATYIVSGGGIDLIRAFSAEVYGVPPPQVVGSSFKTEFEIRDGRAELVKLTELQSFDDREAKVSNIWLHIGKRPIFAFGNSDGDLAMLRFTKTGPGPRLALLLHHDDPAREFAYDRDFHISPLADALDNAGEYGLQLVSMRESWARVFD